MQPLSPAFLNQPLNRQMRALAANLARVASLARKSEQAAVIPPLLRESMAFIEWLAPRYPPEIGGELADMQLMLALWCRAWPEAQKNVSLCSLLYIQAKKWSDQLLDYSGLLNESPAPDPVAA